MARRNRERDQRDNDIDTLIANDISSLLEPSPVAMPRRPVYEYVAPPEWSQIQDARTWQPGRTAATASAAPDPVLISGQPARLKAVQTGKTLSPKIAFASPAETLVCARRGMRREVLFAKRKTGGGGSRKRFNFWSKVKC